MPMFYTCIIELEDKMRENKLLQITFRISLLIKVIFSVDSENDL